MCQLSEKTDSGIPGYAGRVLDVGHVIAPPGERERGDLSFKIDLRCVREMFNSLPHSDFGKSYEINLAKGLQVLIPHPDKGIGMHIDSDTAINTDQCTGPGIRIYPHPDDGLSDSRCPVDSRLDRLTGLGSVLVSIRSRLNI